MLLKPVYANDRGLVDRPLTDVHSPWVPKEGVHLYHFPLSLDSQKARVCLEELGILWESRVILLIAHQQYSPAYVRINSRCVVPTLVIDGKVTTDTINMLRYLADRFGADTDSLQTSDDERILVDYWVEKSASLFIEALTYGYVEGAQKSFPWSNTNDSGKSHLAKVNLLSKLIEKYQDDDALKLAYEKKRAVTDATRNAIVTPTHMSAIVESTRDDLDELEQQLNSGPFGAGGWVASKDYSLADIQWGAALYRLRWLGLQPLLWEEDSRLTAYAERLFARKSFQRGVIAWSNIGRNVVLPLLRHKLLTAVGFNRET